MGAIQRNRANVARVADEAERCYQLRLQEKSIREIAEETGLGRETVRARINTFAEQRVAPMVDEYRRLENDKLDLLERMVHDTLRQRHVVVSHGHVVYQGDEPLLDPAPVYAAVDRLIRIQERRAKLNGLDAPQKTQVSGTLTYVIEGVNMDAV